MKKVIVAIILIALIAVGVLFFVNNQPKETQLSELSSGETTSTNGQVNNNTTDLTNEKNTNNTISASKEEAGSNKPVSMINSDKPILYLSNGSYIGYFHNGNWYKPNDIKLKYIFDNQQYTVYTRNFEKLTTNKLMLSFHEGMGSFNYEGNGKNKNGVLSDYGTNLENDTYIFELPTTLTDKLNEAYTINLDDEYVSNLRPYIEGRSGEALYDCLITYNGDFDINHVNANSNANVPDDVKHFIEQFVEKNGLGSNIKYNVLEYYKYDINNDGFEEELFVIQSKDSYLMRTTSDEDYQANYEIATKEFEENGSFSIVVLKNSEAIETIRSSVTSLESIANNEGFLGVSENYYLTVADLNKDGIYEIVCHTSGWEYWADDMYVFDDGKYIIINDLAQEVEHDVANVYFDTNKKFVYLINNCLFATRVGNKFSSAQNSKITLDDLFKNKAFYSFDSNENKEKYLNKILINKFIGVENETDDNGSWAKNDSWFTRVQNALKHTKEARVYEGTVNELAYRLRAEKHEYKLPAYPEDNSKMDYKTNLGVYGASIEIGYGDFITNDANLKMIEAEKGTGFSQKAQEHYNQYIQSHGTMSIKTEPLVDSYTLNIDQDEEKETIYLVHSNVFDSYNLPEDYNIDEDMIAMLIVEDQDNIFSYLLCTLFMTSSSADEFFNILFSQTWKTDISLRFADFDHDGLAEILVKSNELQAESFDVWELFSIKGNKFTNLVTFEGPNE